MTTEQNPNHELDLAPNEPNGMRERKAPDWLPAGHFVDSDLGVLLAGKEAQINLVERVGHDGGSCLLACKQYIPRKVAAKGELESKGLRRASTFRNDVAYREGRQIRGSRDQRAVAQMSAHGQRLLQSNWTGHEAQVLQELWDAGLKVPYPVSHTETSLTMQYVGDASGAAPQLAKARLRPEELGVAFVHLEAGIRTMARSGWVHADLSAFNLLWWEGEVWFIDFPQAVDLTANEQALNFLHRDVLNVCTWFGRRGLDVDGDELFASLLSEIW